jgi:hypothetical protein
MRVECGWVITLWTLDPMNAGSIPAMLCKKHLAKWAILPTATLYPHQHKQHTDLAGMRVAVCGLSTFNREDAGSSPARLPVRERVAQW